LILSLINLVVFAWLYIRSPQHRWPVFLIFTGQVISRVLLVAKLPQLDDTLLRILPFAVPFVAYAIALFRFRIFDPIPLARQTAIDQLQTGMIVLDSQQRVASLNPSAEKILNTTTSQARNRPVHELLPESAKNLFEQPPGMESECRLGARNYTLSLSLLKDFRGLLAGYMLMMHDITDQKQAQAQIMEQQRILATQDERDRMARELHDSLGQVLGFASLQAQSAAGLARNGQGQAAGAQLERLDSVVREAHADLREYILNLRSTALLQQPFFSAVKHYLDGFTSNYDIQTSLNLPAGFACEACPPETQLQIFRILQEALSNARKHGKARLVQVIFTRQEDRLCMSIQDDGSGFDMDVLSKQGGTHYGLQFMRERAAQMDGRLDIRSSPGAGTTVELRIPYKEG
jgi:PAS domain S-box-containing protein